MYPAHERLESGDLPRRQLDFGLEVYGDFIATQSESQSPQKECAARVAQAFRLRSHHRLYRPAGIACITRALCLSDGREGGDPSRSAPARRGMPQRDPAADLTPEDL